MKNILGIQWGDTATVSAIKDGKVINDQLSKTIPTQTN